MIGNYWLALEKYDKLRNKWEEYSNVMREKYNMPYAFVYDLIDKMNSDEIIDVNTLAAEMLEILAEFPDLKV